MHLRSRGHRGRATTACVIAAGLLLAGCGGGSDDSKGGSAGGSIESVLSADPSSFDPALARAVNDYTLNRLLFDSVMRKGADGQPVGGLAEEWEAKSATDYSFTIKDGATCSDGTAIDAQVVADSLAYLADPATESTWRPLVFGSGKVDVKADVDARTVSIKLSEPFSQLLDTLALPQAGIICPDGLKDPAALGTGKADGAYSGPYKLEKAETGIGYTLAFQKGYDAWPEHVAALEGTAPTSIYFGISTDASSIVNQLISGDLNLALLAAEDTIERVEGNDSLKVVESSDVSLYLAFNERKGRFFADEANRRAVAQAIDAKAFDAAFSGSRNRLISSVASPDLDCVLEDTSLLQAHDPAAAKSVLDGKSFKFLSYTAITAPATDYAYTALEATGAKIKLDNPDIATWSATINNPEADWDLAVYGDRNTARLVSASLERMMGAPIEDGGRNIGGVDNPEGAELVAKGLASDDVAERCQAFEEAQKTMLDRVDLVPLVAANQFTVVADNVSIQAYSGSIDHSTIRMTD